MHGRVDQILAWLGLPHLAERLPLLANVHAATISAYQTAGVDSAAGNFDLLLIEDADSLTEAELLKLVRHVAV